VTLTFFALRIAGGDPTASLLSQGLASPAQVADLRQELGLDLPVLTQYARYLDGILRMDLGTSLLSRRPVAQTIAEQMPSTAALALSAFLLALVLGLTLGILSARWRTPPALARASEIVAGLGTALPVSFTGILAILILGLAGAASAAALRYPWLRLLIPALVLCASPAGALARLVQAGVMESTRSPYFLAARARGIRPRRILLWHALRPVLAPVISLAGLEAAFLFSGTVVTETVFSRPGLGRLLVQSILQGDFPVAQGLVALAAILYSFTHLAAAVVALTLDPRLRREPG
jgi:ABC-type dipeptide/oligopeptide/nickel transport system permease component